MNEKRSPVIVGARSFPEKLTVERLLMFAERVIRMDRDAAVRTQSQRSDGAVSEMLQVSPSTLEDLKSNTTRPVRIKSEHQEDDSADNQKIVKLNRPPRNSKV